jgi:hypothetical protein
MQLLFVMKAEISTIRYDSEIVKYYEVCFCSTGAKGGGEGNFTEKEH